jgi:histone-lysine N-methyltransferase SUV39H
VSPPDESLPETQRVSSLLSSPIPSSLVDDLSVVQFTPARTMLEFAPRIFYSRDIPHALQDLMNSVEAPYRQSIVAKEMFEAVIYENTYEDEPSAPRISIVNDVDGDLEVTPAWEFHYSNRIWHSDGVPPPDLANLRGCDCEGYCDPKSQTCSCLKRQQEYSGHMPGFIYDEKGRLKQRGFPIFECNDLCGCLDGCRNRVRLHQIPRDICQFILLEGYSAWSAICCQHSEDDEQRMGYVSIYRRVVLFKTCPIGVFAGRQKIPKGSFIGVYAGELLTENEGEERGM